MTDWTCLKCGTMNEDPFDKPIMEYDWANMEKLLKEKQAIEEKGEIYKQYCSRCNLIRS